MSETSATCRVRLPATNGMIVRAPENVLYVTIDSDRKFVLWGSACAFGEIDQYQYDCFTKQHGERIGERT